MLNTYMDPKEFQAIGLLQEANRQFFHPLGLALTLNVETGEIRIWDDRKDPGGIYYGYENSTELRIVEARKKADKVAAMQLEHRAAREQRFNGQIIEPIRRQG